MMTETPLIVSPQWLNENLDDPNLVIVDCRFSLADTELGQRQYQENHIPGAFYLNLDQDLSSPVTQHGGRHPLPDWQKLSQTLSKIGITSHETFVVIYDDSRFAFASRFWWLLRFMGHEKVALLDGGFSRWQESGYPVTSEIPTAKPGQFVPQFQPDKIVDIETVRSSKDLPNVVLIDSRERDRYLGLREPIDPVAGHIPGAVNYPWQDVTDDKGFVKTVEEQSQRWSEIKNAEQIIVYCGSGVTACVNLLSLELAGIPNTKLYAGSWSDWCSYLIDET